MRTRQLVATVALVSSVALGMSGCASDDAAVTDVGAQDLIEVVESPQAPVVLDVRTPEEFAAGHVEGALNIDIASPDFDEQIAALAPEQAYVVYCRSGNRSADAAARMAEAGFTEVYNVDAGLATLDSAGVPLTQ